MIVILFLDFDGVMHPVGSGIDRIFQHANLLSTWLHQHPEVRLVVSSSWREQFSLSELGDLLFHDRPELQDRVAGATPILKFVDSAGSERETECRIWLYDNEKDYDYAAWIAIDDQPELFKSLSPEQLVLCDPSIGLTEAGLQRAWQALNRFRSEEVGRRARGERSWEPLLINRSVKLQRHPLPDERLVVRNAAEDAAPRERREAEARTPANASLSNNEATASAANRRAMWAQLPRKQRWVTILLDLDDVLCVAEPAAARILHGALRRGEALDQALLDGLFSPAGRDVLAQAQQEMGGLIRFVISSSWREHFSRDEIEQIFRGSGLTFVADNLHEGPAWRCYRSSFRTDRAIDVEHWIEMFHHGEPFVVIDDTGSGGSLNFHRHFPESRLHGRVILCRPGIGLTAGHMDELLAALRTPFCHPPADQDFES